MPVTLRVRPLLAAVGLLAALSCAACTSAASPPAPDPRDTPAASLAPAPQATGTAPAGVPLPAACTAWAESPQKAIGFQPLETHSYVVNAIWQRVEGTFTFEVAWTNNTDLVAVGLSTDVTFVLGGHDITDDLPRQGLVQKYQPYELETLPPRATDGTGEVSFHTPPNPLLAEANGRRTLVEAESTVAGWCIPAATPDP